MTDLKNIIKVSFPDDGVICVTVCVCVQYCFFLFHFYFYFYFSGLWIDHQAVTRMSIWIVKR